MALRLPLSLPLPFPLLVVQLLLLSKKLRGYRSAALDSHQPDRFLVVVPFHAIPDRFRASRLPSRGVVRRRVVHVLRQLCQQQCKGSPKPNDRSTERTTRLDFSDRPEHRRFRKIVPAFAFDLANHATASSLPRIIVIAVQRKPADRCTIDRLDGKCAARGVSMTHANKLLLTATVQK